MSTMNGIFLWCLSSSIMASVMALIVVLAKVILKNRINVRVYCGLWFLMLIKLAIPFAPESPISIFNTLLYQGQKDAMHQYNMNLVFILSLVWLSGAVILIIVVIYSNIIFSMKSKHFLNIDDPETLSVFDSCKSKLGIETDIQLFLAPCIKSPCIAGVINPKILIPENTYELMNHHQLKHILMHELAHYKRGDVLLNYLITAVNIFYWFNPFICYAFTQMNRDREIACDTYVLESLEQDEAISYAMTLIRMTRYLSQSRPKINFVCFYKSERQIERRIERIKIFRKGSYKISAVALVCCIMFGAMTLTNPTSFKKIAFAQIEGKAEFSNASIENDGSLLLMAHKLSENLNSWLCNEVLPVYDSLYCITRQEEIKKYLEK